ncbi:g5148 [Coccomyxa viridis]|uniref:G5148 protein n=1 Tax=Coccomyxa viridis TaxID=1274662 RepID=A0ABP1FUN3_9CHLO
MTVSPAAACNSSTYLLVELWDLGQLMLSSPVPAKSSHRADSLLGMAQGMAPSALYKGPGSWDIQPPQALFDTDGYELTSHYMSIQA